MPFTLLVDGYIDNVLVRIAPELNQPLFQFINGMDVWYTCSCMIVYIWKSTGLRSGLLRGPQIQGNNVCNYLVIIICLHSSLTVSQVHNADEMSCW